ncbi:inositol 1,4,5-triphosphate receptor associated 2-like [Coregonus clupeaformis]|uniref:inositol 1,4,5-triphosphate receptor associated 2-like n=1 Tax=Coregonus clupeaformis TaxID=59861 RepID=UPI001BE03F58|nr:inositol 1,4,5-triphosphate receptor associated 2-like [Coregonus clupeaformis]
MTEEEVESAFTQLALAFRCDQYTLAQRLQAEEHDRTVAQENLNLELERARDTLQSLRGRCVDAERSEMLSCIEASLDTVLDGVSDIIAAAEMLGSVHQEARVCCSVEMMEVHVEHLKRRHAVESAELLETRKQLYRRIHSDSGKCCPSVARRNYDTDNR